MSYAWPLVMRVAVPPAMGSVYRSPSSSNTMVRPSGDTSSEIHEPSVVVKSSERVPMSGSDFVLPAAVFALSFCVAVCADAAVTALSRRIGHDTTRWRCFMRGPTVGSK